MTRPCRHIARGVISHVVKILHAFRDLVCYALIVARISPPSSVAWPGVITETDFSWRPRRSVGRACKEAGEDRRRWIAR
jgi:hypothetical protein